MSGIILRSYYRFLSGADRELDKQIEKYQHYYKITAIPHRDTYPEGVKRLTFGSRLHYKSEENGSGCIIVQLNVKDDHPWIYDYYFGWKKIDKDTLQKPGDNPEKREMLLKELFGID